MSTFSRTGFGPALHEYSNYAEGKKGHILWDTVPPLSGRGEYVATEGKTDFYKEEKGTILAVTTHTDGRAPTAFRYGQGHRTENANTCF